MDGSKIKEVVEWSVLYGITLPLKEQVHRLEGSLEYRVLLFQVKAVAKLASITSMLFWKRETLQLHALVTS